MIILTGVSSSPGYKTALKLRSLGYQILGVYNTHAVENINAIKFDLTKDPSKLIYDYKPETVIHMAAIGEVDKCESDQAMCYLINTIATRELAKASYKIGSRFIYLSTDYVFDGSKGLYTEEDPPRPINYYGLTKLLGEEATLSINGVIIRTAWIYGLGPGRVNFGRFVIDKLSRGEEIRAIVDQWSSPTLNTLIAEAVVSILKRDFTGIIHVAGPRMSRYEFALAIADVFGFPKSLIKPVSINEVGYKAPRPRDSSLNNSKATQMLNIPLNDIKYALEILKREWLGEKNAI
ncbi:MAG: dTDP-4-dehydrorhamnose reductase [Sulfolobales archaeon]